MGFAPEQAKKARVLAGLTQKQVAQQIGRTNVTVSFYENGLICPPLDRLQLLAKALGVKVDDLLDGSAK